MNASTGYSALRSLLGWGVFAVIAFVDSGSAAGAGTWTKVTQNAPAPIHLMLLLSDGTVMCAQSDFTLSLTRNWYRLTPNAQGSYVNGTWTALANSIDTRLHHASQVLRDGRVFVAGGQFGTGYAKAEVYDPVTNVWTNVTPGLPFWNPATDGFSHCVSEILPDGQVLIMPNAPHVPGTPLRYNPSNNTWSNAGPILHGSDQSEASWVKLADDSILTVDPSSQLSERYIPATNTWINDSNVPVALYDSVVGKIGAAMLLPAGNILFLGSTGHTALYSVSGTTAPGMWLVGPDIPSSKATPDAPAAVLTPGNLLCAVGPSVTSGNPFPTPTTFYEYSPYANAFSSAPSPIGTAVNQPTYQSAFLCLPDGGVLWSHGAADLYEYTPAGVPLAAGKPTISSITPNADGSYHLIGTGLNGLTEGAAYGDDAQMSSNYPLVRLTSGANVYYARTYAWSGTSVNSGNKPISTEFRLPSNLPPSSYSLVVVTNGIESDAVTFVTPNCQADLGFGGPGSSVLSVCGGDLSTGTTAELFVKQARPNSAGFLFAGFQETHTHLLGGTLIPFPFALQVAMTTDAEGQAHVPAVPGGNGPVSLYVQFLYADPSQFLGVGFSNAVRLDFLP